MQSKNRSNCPISFALEIFGDRWTLLVLRDLLLRARRRYRELLAAEEGIATNVLADRLKRLEGRGLIKKERDPEDGRQFVYAATPLAVSLVPVLIEMTVWGARNGRGTRADQELIRRFDTERDTLIAEIQAQVRRDNGLV
jgi:DNA-binding HxlR family transcriptional regulator